MDFKQSKWSNQQTKTFLSHVRQHPCLWSDQEASKKMRVAAKRTIATALGLRSSDTVQQRLRTITDQYLQEKQRMEVTSSPPQIDWFGEAEFLGETGETTECETTTQIKPEMCRVCLAPINERALQFQDFSAKFTDCTGFMAVTSSANQPAYICKDCHAELLVCCKFLDKARQTESILSRLDDGNEMLTDEGSLDCIKLEIESIPSENRDTALVTAEPEPDQTAESQQKSKGLKVICSICGKLLSKSTMKRHFSAHTGQQQQRYVCDLCGKDYKHKEGLTVHLRSHTNEKRYQCQFCDMKFLNWAARRFHIRSKHMIDKPFHCFVCQKGFLTRPAMHAHVQDEHGDASWECEQCKKVFKKKGNYTTHLKLVHGNLETIACDVCGKEFKTRKYLKQHYVIHTGEKNYICPVKVCGKAFAQNHVRRSHVGKMHPEAMAELPPSGTWVSVKAVERRKELEDANSKYVKTNLLF
jgi:uncharacterized C2H2 Zn-finger protein